MDEYLRMIQLKTSVLLAASLKMGAILGGAGEGNQQHLYEFGKNLGIAFQVQDDYLDAFGDPDKFGKQLGGDILANKKTYLLLKALELASSSQEKELKRWLSIKDFDDKEKVNAVKNIFMETGVKEKAEAEMENYFQKSTTALNAVNADDEKKQQLIGFSEKLMQRQH